MTDIQGYSIHDGPGIRTVVFLKGCGLDCLWCSNPECISPRLEIGLLTNLCVKCGDCAGVCPQGALSWEAAGAPEPPREDAAGASRRAAPDGLPRIDRVRCDGCGECAAACRYAALVVYGKRMTVDEAVEAAACDRMFYESSGGGVTVSGGEPLLQPVFVAEFLARCRDERIDTCIETAGQAPTASLQQVLPHTDHVLFDLKLLDSIAHEQYTGRSNRIILENAAVVADSDADVMFRMPLIPGINDDRRNVEETAAFIRGFGTGSGGRQGKRRRGGQHVLQLMPYHRLGKGKYESLDRLYRLCELPAPQPQHVEKVRQMFITCGVACTISE